MGMRRAGTVSWAPPRNVLCPVFCPQAKQVIRPTYARHVALLAAPLAAGLENITIIEN